MYLKNNLVALFCSFDSVGKTFLATTANCLYIILVLLVHIFIIILKQ